MKITVKGKEFEINASYGDFEALYSKYDFNELETQTWKEQNGMVIDAFWAFLKRRWYGLKPFVTKKRFKYALDMPELTEISLLLPKLLTGGDKNLGNSA